MPSLLHPPAWVKSWVTYHWAGTSASFAQNAPAFFHDRAGSRSGLNISTVTRPRPAIRVRSDQFDVGLMEIRRDWSWEAID